MYVSSDGNDSTGQVYSPSQLGNPFEPGQVNAYASFESAFAQTRPDHPDWVLLRRGDVFTTDIDIRSGRSESQFAVLGWYGSSGAMPIVRPADPLSVLIGFAARQYTAIVGIDFYSRTRDPSQVGFSTAGAPFLRGVPRANETIRHVLIEGCKIRFFADGIVLDRYLGQIENVVLRRNLVLNQYSAGTGHAQGLAVGGVDGLVIEENVFDHNGWYSQAGSGGPGEATMFNHNVYIRTSSNILISENIFSRASSMGNKFTAMDGPQSSRNIEIIDNLYLDGEIGISIGGNEIGAYRFENIRIEGNIFTEMGRSQPTNRALGWGVDVQDWDGGAISGNYFLHYTNPAVTGIYGMEIQGGTRNLQIDGNLLYNLNPHGNSAGSNSLQVLDRDTKSNISVSRNVIEEPAHELGLLHIADSSDLTDVSFGENSYYSPVAATAFRVGSSTMDFLSWVKIAGDQQSAFESLDHPDPSRSVARYMESIGQVASIDGFIDQLRRQGRFSWDQRFSAPTVNDWIKAGYIGLGRQAQPAPPSGIRLGN